MNIKQLIPTLLLLGAFMQGVTQTQNTDGVSISNNNVPPHDNAIFHAMSDLPTPKKGMIIPRMTFSQMVGIVPENMTTAPNGWPDGLLVYVTNGGYKTWDLEFVAFDETEGCYYNLVGTDNPPNGHHGPCGLTTAILPTTDIVEEYHGLWYWDNSHDELINTGMFDPTPGSKKWRKVGKDCLWYENASGEVYRDDTYVGIGTDDPENPLEIKGLNTTDATLRLSGTGRDWTSDDWNVRLETPMSAMWATSDDDPNTGLYFGTGMSEGGWYWMHSPNNSSGTSNFDYAMKLHPLSTDVTWNTLMLQGGIQTKDASGNLLMEIGRANVGTNEINYPTYSLDLQYYTGQSVNIGSHSGWPNGATPADLWVHGGLLVEDCAVFNTGISTTNICSASDENLKHNIEDLPDVLDKVLNLRGVTYEWNADMINQTGTKIGVIAQEVEVEFPELIGELPVITDYGSNQDEVTTEIFKSVDYQSFVPILIEAIKEQQQIIDELNSRVTALEQQ